MILKYIHLIIDLIGPMGPNKGDIDMESREENKIEKQKIGPVTYSVACTYTCF